MNGKKNLILLELKIFCVLQLIMKYNYKVNITKIFSNMPKLKQLNVILMKYKIQIIGILKDVQHNLKWKIIIILRVSYIIILILTI